MSKTVFKRLTLPEGMTSEEKLKLCAAHINDLETRLEIAFEKINGRLSKEDV